MGVSFSTNADRESTTVRVGSFKFRLPFALEYTEQSVLGACANVIAQYSFTAGSVTLLIIAQRDGGISESPLVFNDSAVFAGCLLGALTLGYAGDIMGRNNALYIATWILIFGLLCSMLLVWGNPDLSYDLLAVFRIIIGIGVGGTWPSTASTAFENDEGANGVYEQRLRNMAWVFGFQQVGQLLPYVAGLFLLTVFHKSTYSVQFRLVYFIGAVACMVILHFLREVGMRWDEELRRVARTENRIVDMARTFVGSQTSEKYSSMLYSSLNYVEMFRRVDGSHKWLPLLGCSLSFFCSYFYNYGVTMFTVRFMQEIYSDNLDLSKEFIFYVYSVLATIPSTWLSIILLGRMGTRNLQLLGFGLAFLLFGICALVFKFDIVASDVSLMACVLAIRAVSRFGAPTTAFIMPSLIFEEEIRSSTTGISCVAGLVGAFTSVFVTFKLMEKDYGIWAVFTMYCGVAAAGLLSTWAFIPIEELTSVELEALALGSRAEAWARNAGQRAREAAQRQAQEASPLLSTGGEDEEGEAAAEAPSESKEN